MKDLLLLLIGFGLGAATAWFFMRPKLHKSGEIKSIAASLQTESPKPMDGMPEFEKLLRNDTWTLESKERNDIWTSNSNSAYQIEPSQFSREVSETWTSMYPDPKANLHQVHLLVNGVTIKKLSFTSIDGGRIFVPEALKRVTEQGQTEFYWDLDSLEVAVCRVIGSYYIYDNLEGIAKKSNVQLVQSTQLNTKEA